MILAVSAVVASTPDSAAVSLLQSQSWESLARKYVDLEASVRSGTRTATDVYETWTEIETALANAAPPVRDLRRGLESTDLAERTTALAAMGVARVQDDGLFRLVLRRFTQGDADYYRKYAARALANMSPRQVDAFGDDLVVALSQETKVMVVVAARPVLTQLSRPQALRLMSALAVGGDRVMRRVVRAMASQREDGFLEELLQSLERSGASDAASDLAGHEATGAAPSHP
ncbi:hypothetical protein ACOQFB_08400 [Anaeromyxobacter sp. Red801]|uniref:hypothetical protein n=1 Tax=Anaeromyxobacter sp. Red801 TaxID=3411632 RepID=UPI003B9FBB63